MTSQQDLLVLWFPLCSTGEFFMLCTTFPTLVFVLLGGCSLGPSCGLASLKMSPPGPEPLLSARKARFISTFMPQCIRYLFHLEGSATSTLTLLDLCQVPEVKLISSPSWTGCQVGQKLFLCLPYLLGIVPELSSLAGSRDWGSCQDYI